MLVLMLNAQPVLRAARIGLVSNDRGIDGRRSEPPLLCPQRRAGHHTHQKSCLLSLSLLRTPRPLCFRRLQTGGDIHL